ncbi:MAG: hypothetical protein Q7S69_09910 [Nitrosomonadaceae bacterium]|nr:hypothetical protein [Nitrosomonadaceae bacterium]
MDTDQKERYVRWTNYRITHLSYSINIFLGFAVASLAFLINIKLEGKPHGTVPINTVMVMWAASAFLGCIATISRLLDFRYTARKIKDGGTLNTFMAKYCGPITMGCFWGQVIAYTIGAYLFVAGVVSI